MRYIASVSFGKDSLAMLLKLIEKKYPLDEVVFYDTGMEFGAIYHIRDKVKVLLEKNNIKFTELHPQCPFEYKMFYMVVNKGKPNEHKGYSWCGGRCRWGTTEKLKVLEKYCKNCVEYVGIAADETKRLNKKRNGIKIFPLADWNMTESDCLQYCYKMGYDWKEEGIELYTILDRVSCWCCGNKNLKELYNYYLYLPKYWDRLYEMQKRTNRPFKNNYTIQQLEDKFIGRVMGEDIDNGVKNWFLMRYLDKEEKKGGAK